MAFTGSEKALKELIKANMLPLVTAGTGGDPEATQQVLENLDDMADALSKAIVTWILQAGTNSIQATVAPGIAVSTAGSAFSQTGATTAPGQVATSSLI